MDLIPSVIVYLFVLSVFVFIVTVIALKIFQSIEIKPNDKEVERAAFEAATRPKKPLKEMK